MSPVNRYQWHRWFAWHPIRLSHEVNESPGFSYADSGNWAWLRTVERRIQGVVVSEAQSARDAGDVTGWWEYREPVA